MGSFPHVVEDFQGVLQVYSDGSISRDDNKIDFSKFPVVRNISVSWTDHLYDKTHNLYLRLYKPTTTVAAKSLPIMYYIHGGGFCLGSRTWPNCHNCCLHLASSLPAVVIAPDYRLAPEHKLPAPMEDILSAVNWLKEQAVSENKGGAWLTDDGTVAVDFDRVYLLGDSSGGNVAHHVAVRLGAGSVDLNPVRVRGYVLMAPFFGGVERTKTEAEGPYEERLNLDILDSFWRLSLPIGGTRDHPLANPFGPTSTNLKPLALDPFLIIVGGSEMMRDRIEEYAKKMKELGKKIEYVEFEGKQHGFFTNNPFSEIGNEVVKVLQRFMLETSNL